MNATIRTCFLFLLLGLTIPIQTSFATENNSTLKDTATQTSEAEQERAKKATINPWRLAAKVAVGGAVSLCAHYVLEYISVLAHEHGHGLTGRNPNYIVELMPSGNSLAPWNGVCHGINGSFLSTAAGPLVGICAKYLQCIALETLNGYMQGKSLKESAQQGLRHPFLFLSQAKQTTKKYCSYALNKKVDEQITEPSWSSVILNSILFLRCGSMLGEFIYGLTPYHHIFPAHLPGVIGDGEKLWKMIFGDNCPTFNVNLPGFTLGIMSAPYINGALEAWQSKNKDKSAQNTTALIAPLARSET